MTATPSARRRRPGLGLLPAITMVVALLGAVPSAHAAPVRQAGRPEHTRLARPRHVTPHGVHASVNVPALAGVSAVVTNCTTAGYNNYTLGSPNNVGLGGALAHGNVITFACNAALSGGPGPYTIVPQNGAGTGPETIDIGSDTVSIDGSDGGKNDVALDGGSTSPSTGVQIIFADDGSSLTLLNLTLQHGNAGDVTDDGYGGAVETFGNFTATNVTFANNIAQFNGGALELAPNVDGVVTVQDTITNSTFTNNQADQEDAGNNGGAIDIGRGDDDEPQNVTISQSTFTGNSTLPGGGGNGGAIYVENCNPATVSIAQSLFMGNTADSEGGALENDCDQVTITDSQFTSNTSTNGVGGAIYDDSGQFTNISRSSFIGNSALDDAGGAIENDDGADTIANSTFSGNYAFSSGGAIATSSEGGMTLIADTIAGNSTAGNSFGTSSAGGVQTDTTLNIESSIFSNNVNTGTGDVAIKGGARPAVVAGTVVNCDNFGTINDQGYNLEYSGVGGTDTCTNGGTGDVNGQDPLLAAPANNGSPSVGATATATNLLTMALQPGSPAIGGVTLASLCTAAPVNDVDNRSLPRYATIRGVCDIGAYDTGGYIVPPITITGAFPLTMFPGGPARLGFAASNHGFFTANGVTLPNFPIGYITFQKGGSVFTARQPITVACVSATLGQDHCVGAYTLVNGVPTFVVVPGMATLTLSGHLSTTHGIYPVGALVTVSLTITASPTGKITVNAVSVSVAGAAGNPQAAWTAPFPFATSILINTTAPVIP